MSWDFDFFNPSPPNLNVRNDRSLTIGFWIPIIIWKLCSRVAWKYTTARLSISSGIVERATSSPGRFSLALGAKAREKRPGDEVVERAKYVNVCMNIARMVSRVSPFSRGGNKFHTLTYFALSAIPDVNECLILVYKALDPCRIYNYFTDFICSFFSALCQCLVSHKSSHLKF